MAAPFQFSTPNKPKSTGLFGGGVVSEDEATTEVTPEESKNQAEFAPLKRKERIVERVQNRGQGGLLDTAAQTGGEFKFKAIPPSPTVETKEIKGVEVPGEHNISGTDIVNFLAGSEMAVIGMKLDNQGFQWEWENMKQQWSEQPLWSNLLASTSLIGTVAFPAARAAYVTSKFGKVGQLLGKVAGDAEEISRFTKLKMLDEGATTSSRTLRLLRQQEHARSKYLDLAAKMELDKAGELEVPGVINKLKYQFDKRFANNFYKIANATAEGTGWQTQYHKNLDSLYKSEDIGKFFVDIPGIEDGPKIFQHYLHKLSPNDVPNPNIIGKKAAWADTMYSANVAHQSEALAEGMIDAATYKRIGEAHIPALYKDTPSPQMDFTRTVFIPVSGKKPSIKSGAIKATGTEPSRLGKLFGQGVKYEVEKGEGTKYIALRTTKIPRLDSDTLKFRKADIPEVYRRLLNNELITDPVDLTVHGHIMDRLLLNNFKTTRDLSMDPRYAVSNFDIMAKYKTAKKAGEAGYISFENTGTGISSILKRMIEKKGGKLGPNGELPWVRKEIFEEIFDDSGMFSQTSAAADMMELLTVIHKSSKTGLSIPTHFQNFAGNMVMLHQAGFNPLSPEHIKIQSSMAKAFNQIAHIHTAAREAGYNTRAILDNININLGKITIDGKAFSLNDELLNPMVRELIEESAFETTEGFAHLEKMFDRLRTEQYMTKAVAKTFLKMKKLSQLNDTKGFKWFDQMTKWYLGEDMVPKMSYFMKLRAQGLTREAAVIEVGRRLPMYSTVGSTVRAGRKFAFPWASFPTEALRITKNNLMDNPLRMVPWLHMPQIVQSLMSAANPEVGSPELVAEAKRGLPMYGQKPTTVVSSTDTAAAVGGGVTGGLTGAIAGGVTAGVPGALVGGALGALGGKEIAQYFSDDSKGDVVRGSILNWLPHSSFFLTSNSPDYTLGGGPWETLQQVQEQLPAEPLAILKPLIDIAAGKTDFGADIGAEGLGDQTGKAIAGFMGFLAPPWIQKYGLKTTTPDVAATQQMFGTAFPGDISNVSKLLIDMGASVDPSTGKPGNLSLDLLLNNFGMWKSYSADPKTQLANEVSTDDNMEQIRTYLKKNLDYHLQNGNDDIAMTILTKLQGTYSRQYADNPRKAQEKYDAMLEKLRGSIGKHPKLRRWSEDELKERIREAGGFAGEERGKSRDLLISAMKKELMIRRLSKKQKESGDRSSRSTEKRGLRL